MTKYHIFKPRPENRYDVIEWRHHMDILQDFWEKFLSSKSYTCSRMEQIRHSNVNISGYGTSDTGGQNRLAKLPFSPQNKEYCLRITPFPPISMLIPPSFKPIWHLSLVCINIEEGGEGELQWHVIIGVRSYISINREKIEVLLCFANNFVLQCLRITNPEDKKNKFSRETCSPLWYSMIG